MTWSDRMKLAWTTFKREALPLYGWILIFFGAGMVALIAMALGVLEQLRWIFPNIHSFLGTFSSDMPVPGIPPSVGLAPFHFYGSIQSLSQFLPFLKHTAGTLLLILIVCWLAGAAFYTGIFNLTAKAYHDSVGFRDFSFKGLLRTMSWQALLIIIQLIIFAIGISGAVTLRLHAGPLVMIYSVIYALLIIAIALYTLPWIISSGIYLLIHQEQPFSEALHGSWTFFKNHMGALWGYIGTFILIEIALDILTRISQGLAGIATFAVSPFIAILAIVWVLSLEDTYIIYTATDFESLTANTAPSGTQFTDDNKPDPPKIDLQKKNPLPSDPDDNTPFCPSCGSPNTGTAYCPQCGTKLH
ncbi:hypothetical protein Desor_0294 [Desulfosporosinus orientis DSM 765]|uniref:Uncharacterized protein n=1 Tax=Desulfosporosinus orientis (strain ATCC 19365 / DSM 765 / NCIMB 8382 / VKM B-1628 / Singapore I) TaxID=768706 RepID=G7WA14_DESOD|nr:zinc ribbon domain-containing protein [Desulfosporosinus orientis]AET66010.1 hypothetical protein Desor_0294 [Desulfosporosinus orientis DSM 765]